MVATTIYLERTQCTWIKMLTFLLYIHVFNKTLNFSVLNFNKLLLLCVWVRMYGVYMCVCVCLSMAIHVYMCHSVHGPKDNFQESILSFYLIETVSCFYHIAHTRLAGPWTCSTLHVYVESCIAQAHYHIWLFNVGSNNGSHGSRLWGLELYQLSHLTGPIFCLLYLLVKDMMLEDYPICTCSVR